MSRPASIYLDHASSSPLRPGARSSMVAAWDLGPGNPASTHHAGRALRRALEDSREKVASLLGAFPDEVIFTSGATESNNLALTGHATTLGASLDAPMDGNWGLVSSPIEHASIRQPLMALRGSKESLENHPLVLVPPRTSGHVGVESFTDAIRNLARPSGLAALQLANQETGALQPVEIIANWLAREYPRWRLHTDATQALGKNRINFHRLMVHSLAGSAHKFGGPVGAGVLLLRRGITISALQKGGGQQDDRRAGTESVALAVGLATALEDAQNEMVDFDQRCQSMCRQFLEIFQSHCSPVLLNSPGPGEPCLPHILNVSFPGIRSDTLLMALDLEGLAVSAGSACSSGSILPSTVLLSMNLEEDRVLSAIRISLGWNTEMDQVTEAARRIGKVVDRLRTRQDGP